MSLIYVIATEVSCCLTDMRLENVPIDHIYAGVCVLVQFGSKIRRTMNKPHADVVEWDDEILLWVLPCSFLLLRAYDPKAFR